jgi:hypothetical protein
MFFLFYPSTDDLSLCISYRTKLPGIVLANYMHALLPFMISLRHDEFTSYMHHHPDVGGLLSRSRTSAQGAPESSHILIVVVSLEL